MEPQDHITLPVSALKKEAGRVFDALESGRIVYVSRYGKVVAAFQPDVPAEVRAAYALPQEMTPNELTARDMQRGVPTAAVNDAAAGLLSLLTRDRKVYGMLVPAAAPVAPAAEDIDLAAAEAISEAMNAYLRANPDASIDEITSYRDELDARAGGPSFADAAATSPLQRFDDNEIVKVRNLWTGRGSGVEAIAARLLKRRHHPLPVSEAARWRKRGRRLLDNPAELFRDAARLDRTDPVGAREKYVKILDADPDQGAASWKLGDMARNEGYKREAAQWYSFVVVGKTRLRGLPPVLNAKGPSAGAYEIGVAKRAKPVSRVRPPKGAVKKPLVDLIGKGTAKKPPAKFVGRPRDRVRP